MRCFRALPKTMNNSNPVKDSLPPSAGRIKDRS